MLVASSTYTGYKCINSKNCWHHCLHFSTVFHHIYQWVKFEIIMGGGGGGGWIGFRIVGFHRKNCPDFGSGECFTRISDLINTADCGFI
jgi:hypothetical protein